MQPSPQRDNNNGSSVGSLPRSPGELGWVHLMATESFGSFSPSPGLEK